ncbi:hypothetical protein WEH80_36410 [Actinomycetes bacterium KLBMP 9759]
MMRTRCLAAAEHLCPRVGLDGSVLPPVMAAGAVVFEAGAMSVRHVDAIRRVLASKETERLEPAVCADVEVQLADKAPVFGPHDLNSWG